MKKAFLVPVVFILSFSITAFVLASLFELRCITLGIEPVSFRQYCAVVLQLFPLLVVLSTLFVFSFTVKRKANVAMSALLLAIMLFACIWIFYFLYSHQDTASFILSSFSFDSVHGNAFFLPYFNSLYSTFFTDLMLLSQTSLKMFLLVSTGFSLTLLSYFVVSANCTNWKLLNLIFMIGFTVFSLYLYSILRLSKLQITFDTASPIKTFFVPIIFYAISALLFTFFIIRTLIERHREKQRSSL